MGIRGGMRFQLHEIREHRHSLVVCVLFYFWQECWKRARAEHRFEAVLDEATRAREEMCNGNYRPTLVLIREVTVLLKELGLRQKFVFVDMDALEKQLDQVVAQQEPT